MNRDEPLTLALLDQLLGAIAVVDLRIESLPVVLANQALTELRGFSREALCEAGLAGLLGESPQGPRAAELRRGFGSGETLTVRVALTDPVLGPYTAEIRFEPLRDDAGAVTHYAAFHDRVGLGGARTDLDAAVVRPPLARDDRLTGLRHIDLFHEFYRRDFSIAQREGRMLAVFACDIDALGVYNDTFGRLAGDTVIRRVGRALLSGLRRAGDLVARVEGGRFVGLAAMDAEQAGRHALTLAARVRDLHLHHPRAPLARVVTVTVGVAQVVPAPDATPEQLLRAAQQSLEAARSARGTGPAVAGPGVPVEPA